MHLSCPRLLRFALCLLLLLLALPPSSALCAQSYDLLAKSNLVAWCIVPFDGKKRGPEERAAMLEEIQVKRLAYDYRREHIPTFDAELKALARHNIELTAWWFPGTLNEEALLILDVLKRHGVKTQLWISGGGKPTRTEAEQKARVAAEAARIKPLAEAAAAQGCTVGLYNHGGWFGEPENQIAIIKHLREQGIQNVGIVYNQHHGHPHLERFAELLAIMKPYLLALNLNGMTRNGDRIGKKILPIGQGDLDVSLLRVIQQSGWQGPVGILNHTSEDARARLLDNLEGLEWVRDQMDGKRASPRPVPRSWSPPPDKVSLPVTGGSLSFHPDWGNALRGGAVVEGSDGYRALPLSVECRARLDSRGGFNILVASDPKSSADHWELYSYAGSGVLSLYMPGRGGEFKSSRNICDRRWHYLSAIIESNRVRLYVDGKLVHDATAKPRSGQSAPGGLAFGRLVEGGIGCDGLIDDVRLSRGVRSIEGIPDRPLGSDDRTLGLWDFNSAIPRKAAAMKGDAWAVEDQEARAALPEYRIMPAARTDELTPAILPQSVSKQKQWHRSLGDAGSSRYSALRQIHRGNVKDLKVAWTYHSRDGKGNIQCTPIVVGKVMYAPTSGHHIVAVDAATGNERWRFRPERRSRRLEDIPARRGLLYWEGSDGAPARILFTCGNWIYALDPDTGKPIEGFGKGGPVRIAKGGTAVGAVYKGIFVIPGYLGDVYGYGLVDGKLLWTFHTIPRPGEFGADSWSGRTSGANSWGGMAMDETRGIAYVATGSPKPNFNGTGHHGDNLFANCVIALDAVTGKRLWHFQEIRHDIWDLDIPAPPNLVTIVREGRLVDAVAQVTKLGNTLLLDRVSGRPVFDFRLRRAPVSKLPGERTAAYQPDVELPEPFARQVFTADDVTTRTEEAEVFVRGRLASANYGWFEPFENGRSTVLYGIHGGAEWTGAAFDPATGFLYVSANELPWNITVFEDEPEPPRKPGHPDTGEKLYQEHCASCHGPNRRGIGTAPPLRGLRHRLKDADVIALLKTGRNLMPAAPAMKPGEQKALLDFLFLRDRASSPTTQRAARPSYTHSGFSKFLDHEGYPGCKPPWGTLNCIDLNTGRLRWKVPLGEYPELTEQGLAKSTLR